jgi:hypothetical protein
MDGMKWSQSGNDEEAAVILICNPRPTIRDLSIRVH